MKQNIAELLHKRSDLSEYLVHFTRDRGNGSARDALMQILASGVIEARSNLGLAKELAEEFPGALEAAGLGQKCCCFTETPLEHCWSMVQDIAGRSRQFKPFGIVFSKDFGMKNALNPVWYLNTTQGTDHLTTPVLNIIESCRGHLEDGSKIGTKQDQSGEVLTQPRFEILRIAPGKSRGVVGIG